MAAAWLRHTWIGSSLVAVVALTACKSTKGSDPAEDIPEAPPSSAADAEPAPAEWSSPPVAREPEPAPSAPAPHYHVVKKGDTLFSLARQYYRGDASKWRRIYDANRDQIPDRDRIKVGQELLIPD